MPFAAKQHQIMDHIDGPEWRMFGGLFIFNDAHNSRTHVRPALQTLLRFPP